LWGSVDCLAGGMMSFCSGSTGRPAARSSDIPGRRAAATSSSLFFCSSNCPQFGFLGFFQERSYMAHHTFEVDNQEFA